MSWHPVYWSLYWGLLKLLGPQKVPVAWIIGVVGLSGGFNVTNNTSIIPGPKKLPAVAEWSARQGGR